ncbi:MAG: DNA-directed RNA polymerase subunit omega [Candidatus Methylomirabilales bacterium]
MSYVSWDDLKDKVDSKFRLVIIAAKRSRQLNHGARPLVQRKTVKPTYIALDELAAGRLEYEAKPFEEVTQAEAFAEAVKPMWFREIAPGGVVTEEPEIEEVPELEAVAPGEAEAEEVKEEVKEEAEGPEQVEGELVGLGQVEKTDDVEDET